MPRKASSKNMAPACLWIGMVTRSLPDTAWRGDSAYFRRESRTAWEAPESTRASRARRSPHERRCVPRCTGRGTRSPRRPTATRCRSVLVYLGPAPMPPPECDWTSRSASAPQKDLRPRKASPQAASSASPLSFRPSPTPSPTLPSPCRARDVATASTPFAAPARSPAPYCPKTTASPG